MTSGPLPAAPAENSTLTWDAENRLISATAETNTKTYLYDAQSRRIAESSTINNQLSTIIFLYDGWNCIAEYEGGTEGGTGVPPVLKKSRLWGLDLSGTLQGAGGVGGLLSETLNNQLSTLNSQLSTSSLLMMVTAM